MSEESESVLVVLVVPDSVHVVESEPVVLVVLPVVVLPVVVLPLVVLPLVVVQLVVLSASSESDVSSPELLSRPPELSWFASSSSAGSPELSVSPLGGGAVMMQPPSVDAKTQIVEVRVEVRRLKVWKVECEQTTRQH